MQDLDADLAALVGSRLCHDLISPVGAIQNGLELLALTGGADTAPEMTLIQDSCASAAARIRFFRVAFGSAGDAQQMGRREVVSTLTDLTKGSRMQAEWMPQDDVARSTVQMIFLAYMCCETALPQGGTVKMERGQERWVIEARAPRVLIDGDLWSALVDRRKRADITPDRVQFALLSTLAQAGDTRLVVQTGNEALRIELS